MAHLIKSLVERVVPPKSGQLFLRDDEITVFALRVTTNGAKSFVWEGRINGPMCRDTLGRFPDLSVMEAPAKAFEYKAKIARAKTRSASATQSERRCVRKPLRTTGGRIPEPARETAQTILARRRKDDLAVSP